MTVKAERKRNFTLPLMTAPRSGNTRLSACDRETKRGTEEHGGKGIEGRDYSLAGRKVGRKRRMRQVRKKRKERSERKERKEKKEGEEKAGKERREKKIGR